MTAIAPTVGNFYSLCRWLARQPGGRVCLFALILAAGLAGIAPAVAAAHLLKLAAAGGAAHPAVAAALQVQVEVDDYDAILVALRIRQESRGRP